MTQPLDQEQIDYYTSQARNIAAGIEAAVAEYEEGHPPGTPCFSEVLATLRQVRT